MSPDFLECDRSPAQQTEINTPTPLSSPQSHTGRGDTWKFIKNSKLSGRKFRRQHSVGPYILDFYCVEERLAVELDGEVHRNDRAEAYDYKRKLFLNAAGVKVIRFENFLIFDDIDHVLGIIEMNFGWWKEHSHSGERR